MVLNLGSKEKTWWGGIRMGKCLEIVNFHVCKQVHFSRKGSLKVLIRFSRNLLTEKKIHNLKAENCVLFAGHFEDFEPGT